MAPNKAHLLIEPRAVSALALAGLCAAGWGFIIAQFVALGLVLSFVCAAATVWLYWDDLRAAGRTVRHQGLLGIPRLPKELWIALAVIGAGIVVAIWLATEAPTTTPANGRWRWAIIPMALALASALGFFYGFRERRSLSTSPARSRLYTGEMGMDANKLATEHRLEIWLRAYNGTGKSISVMAVHGSIQYREMQDGRSVDEGRLAAPIILSDRSPVADINEDMEFMIVMNQEIPRPIAEKMTAVLEGGHQVQFILHGLNVMVALSDEAQARLPIWDGLALSKTHRYSSARIVEMRMAASEGRYKQNP
jgi:hypothetical protein